MDWDIIKKSLGAYAVEQRMPEEGLIGLGSGTTSHALIEALGRKWTSFSDSQKEGYSFIATSSHSHKLAHSFHLPLVADDAWHQHASAAFDGADFVDLETGIAIKGLGGALLREKIVGYSSDRLSLLVDERKLISSKKLTRVTIPLEISQFGKQMSLMEVQKTVEHHCGSSASVKYRTVSSPSQSEVFITDNGNYTLDITVELYPQDLAELNRHLLSIPGVVETGIFIGLATEIIIGYADKSIEVVHIPPQKNF